MNEIDFRTDLLPLKNRLYRLALRITLDRVEAEDVTEDTLIRIWEKRSELSAVESLEAYSLTICRNLALDRCARKEAQNESLDARHHDTQALQLSPHDDLVKKERLTLAKRIIDSLPEKQRTVIQLRDIEGKNVAETAAVLGISPSDVKTTLCRARQAIRQKLETIENYGL